MNNVLELERVSRSYGRGERAVHALREVDVQVPEHSFTAVTGPSGSGKSTFLQCAAGLDRPTSGVVRLGGRVISGMGERGLSRLRRTRIGFVFQSFNLLPALTVQQNVLLPLRLDGRRRDPVRARELLARVGLDGRENARPGQLSGAPGRCSTGSSGRWPVHCSGPAASASWRTPARWPSRTPPPPSAGSSATCTTAPRRG